MSMWGQFSVLRSLDDARMNPAWENDKRTRHAVTKSTFYILYSYDAGCHAEPQVT